MSRDKLQIVQDCLSKNGAQIVPHCQAHIAPEYSVHAKPQQMGIQRMAFLCKSTTNRNMRDCILTGQSPETQDAVLSLVYGSNKLQNANLLAPRPSFHEETMSTLADLAVMVDQVTIASEIPMEIEVRMDVDSMVTPVSALPPGDVGPVVPKRS